MSRSAKCRRQRREYLESKARLMSRKKAQVKRVFTQSDDAMRKVLYVNKHRPGFRRALDIRNDLHAHMSGMMGHIENLAVPHQDVPPPPPASSLLKDLEDSLQRRKPEADDLAGREQFITSQIMNPTPSPLHTALEHLVHERVRTEDAINAVRPQLEKSLNSGADVSRLTDQVKDLKSQLKNKSNRGMAEVNALKQELNTHRSQLREHLATANVQEKATQSLRNALLMSQSKHAFDQELANDYLQKWHDCQGQSQQSASELKDMQAHINTLRNHQEVLMRLQAQGMSNRDALQSRINALQREVEQKSLNKQANIKTISELRLELQEGQGSNSNERAVLQEERHADHATIEALKGERNALLLKGDNAQSKIDQLEMELRVRNDRLASNTAKLQQMDRNHDTDSKALENMRKKQAHLEAEKVTLQEALLAETGKSQNSIRNKNALQSRIDELNGQLGKLTGSTANFQRKLTDMTLEKQELGGKLESLTADRDRLQSAADLEAQSHQAVVVNLTSKLEQIQAASASTSAEQVQALAELDAARRGVENALEKQTTASRTQQDMLQAQLDKVKADTDAAIAVSSEKLAQAQAECELEKQQQDALYQQKINRLVADMQSTEAALTTAGNSARLQLEQNRSRLEKELAGEVAAKQTLQSAYDALVLNREGLQSSLNAQMVEKQEIASMIKAQHDEFTEAVRKAVADKQTLERNMNLQKLNLQAQINREASGFKKNLDALINDKQQLLSSLKAAEEQAAVAAVLQQKMEGMLSEQASLVEQKNSMLLQEKARTAEALEKLETAKAQTNMSAVQTYLDNPGLPELEEPHVPLRALYQPSGPAVGLQQELDDSIARQSVLQQQVDSLTSERASMEEKLGSAMESAAQHQADMVHLQEAANTRLKAVEAESRVVVDSLQAQVDLLQTKGVGRETEREQLRNELEKARKNFTAASQNLQSSVNTKQVFIEQLEGQLLQADKLIATLQADKVKGDSVFEKYEALAKAFDAKDQVVAEQRNKLLLAESEAQAQQERLIKLEGAHAEVVEEVEVAKLMAERKLTEALAEASAERAANDARIKVHAAELMAATERVQASDEEHLKLKQEIQQLVADGLLDQTTLDEHQARIEQLMGELGRKDAELKAGREELVGKDSDWQAALALKEQIIKDQERDFADFATDVTTEREKKSKELVETTKQLQHMVGALQLAEDELERLRQYEGEAPVEEEEEGVSQPDGRTGMIKSLLAELIDLTTGHNKQGYIRNLSWMEDAAHVDEILGKEAAYKQALQALKHSVFVCVIINTYDVKLGGFTPLPPSLQLKEGIVGLAGRRYDKFYSAQLWDEQHGISELYTSQAAGRTSLSDMVSRCEGGGSSIIFTYGLSGSGKTQAMFGSMAEPGIMLSALMQLHAKGAQVTHHSDMCLYGTLDIPDLIAHPIEQQVDQLTTIRHRRSLLKSEELVIPGDAHRPGAQVTGQSIRQILMNHPAIRPTPNNSRSSRGHLFMTWEVRLAGQVGYLTFVDMAGSESPKLIAEAFGVDSFVKAKRLQGVPDDKIAKSISTVRDHAFFGTMKWAYLKTDPDLARKLEIHSVLTEGFFINETLNQLSDFFQLERNTFTGRQYKRLNGGWNDARVNEYKFNLSIYTPDMIRDAYINPTPHLDPVGFVRQLIRLRSLADKSSVFAMVALANPHTVSELDGVSETLDFAQRLC